MNNIPALLNHLDANREARKMALCVNPRVLQPVYHFCQSPTLSLAYASISDEGIVEANKWFLFLLQVDFLTSVHGDLRCPSSSVTTLL